MLVFWKKWKGGGKDDDEDEYDLYFALDQNTDPLITKLIAGSLIVALLALLVVGVVIPSTTDYGEGVCNPILTGGRCGYIQYAEATTSTRNKS